MRVLCGVEGQTDPRAMAGVADRRVDWFRMRDRNSLPDGVYEHLAPRSGVDRITHLPGGNYLPLAYAHKACRVRTLRVCRSDRAVRAAGGFGEQLSNLAAKVAAGAAFAHADGAVAVQDDIGGISGDMEQRLQLIRVVLDLGAFQVILVDVIRQCSACIARVNLKQHEAILREAVW